MTQNHFGKFLQTEMQRMGMSAREFASYVGVAHTTISRAMDADPPQPSLSFLVKLVQATDADICTLVALAVPELETEIDPQVQLLAAKIQSLSPTQREFLEDYLLGASINAQERD